MAKGVCNIIVISHIHIYLHCIYVFVYWYHLYDCVYHEINNYFIKLKQFFLFDKEYSTCTMVWKNRTRHNTTCLLFGWRYFFFIRRKISYVRCLCLTYQSIIPMHDTESAFTCIRTISFSCSSSRKNDWFTLFEKWTI